MIIIFQVYFGFWFLHCQYCYEIYSKSDELKLIFGDFLSEHDELSDGLIAQSEQPLHVSTGNSSNPVDLAPTGDSTNQGDIFTVPDHLISSTLAKSVDCTEIGMQCIVLLITQLFK